VGRASSAKRARRQGSATSGAPNPWDRPTPADGTKPQAVIDGLARQMAQLEARRHAIHADDRRIAAAAAQHHDRSRDQAKLLGDDLAHDPDDDLLGRAQAGHLAERRGAEEVHRQVAGRVREFRPKI
jgi:hypothetical protein